MANKKRLKPDVRKEQIIQTALTLARRGHYASVTREAIAAEIGVTGQAVQYHYGTMAQLRAAMVRAAVKLEDCRVMAQALVANDPRVADLPRDLRARCLLSV